MACELEDYLHFARHLARIAAAEIMPRYQGCAIQRKPDGTEVTEADRAAEAAIRTEIGRRYPGHQVLGEEYGGCEEATPGLQWIVDPIDGTAAFTLGVPTFGTLIALARDGEPICGVIHLPAAGETVFAARGLGCWYQAGEQAACRVEVDPVRRLADAVVSATSVHSSDLCAAPGEIPYRLSRVIRGARKFRFVGDCLQHALICRGRVHAAVDPVMKPWDIAALVPCVEEAGGATTGLHGRREGIIHSPSLVAAATAELQAELLATLRPEQSTGSAR